MWHASVASAHLTAPNVRQAAKEALQGVGDPRLGEWIEEYTKNGLRFCHIKRRLKPKEETHIGPAVDIRGTSEYRDRLAKCPWLPPGYKE